MSQRNRWSDANREREREDYEKWLQAKEEEAEYKDYRGQENKLIQLHKYHPNLNMSLAEELQRAIGHPIPFKRYVRKQIKKGVPFEKAIENYQEGGPVVEGVGKGPATNLYPDAPKVLQKKNAANMGLFEPRPPSNTGASYRKTRRRRSNRKSRRNNRKSRRA
jgi:hypothetical protein